MNNPLLDEILIKSDEQLTDGERETIKGNKDYLNPDEQTRFKDLWSDAEVVEDTGGTLKKEELDVYLETKRKQWEAEGKSDTEIKHEEDKVEAFLTKHGEPANWHDTFSLMKKYFVENPEELAPAIKEQFDTMTDTEQKEVTAEVTKWTQSYDKLAVTDKLPASTTKDGQDALSKIGALMTKYENYNFESMYDLYKALPVNRGGGHIISSDAPAVETKPINPNRKAASMIGGGTGGDSPAKAPVTYADIRNKSMAQIGDDMLKN